VSDVRDGGRQGIHHVFELPCNEDLREDVGALAASRGWALRELSWQRPSLEQLFARIALDLPFDEPAQVAAPAPAANELQGSVQLTLPKGEPAKPAMKVLNPFETPAAPATPPAAPKVVYNLNPFDMGATRDLSKPKAIDGPGTPPAEPRP
jgi:hypothetical protein